MASGYCAVPSVARSRTPNQSISYRRRLRWRLPKQAIAPVGWTEVPWVPLKALHSIPIQGNSRCLALSADGVLLCGALNNMELGVWDSVTGKKIHTLRGHSDWISTATISGDGRTIVTGSDDTSLRGWDRHTGHCSFVLNGHTGNVLCSTIDHHGLLVVSGSLDGTVRVWDIRTKTCRHVLEGHSDWVRCCAVSKEHGLVVSGSRDRTLKLWCLKTGELLRTLHGHQDRVISCAISKDGQWISSASEDNTVKLWDAKTGECVDTVGKQLGVTCCGLDSRGSVVVSGAYKSLLAWDFNRKYCLTCRIREWDAPWIVGCIINPKKILVVSSKCKAGSGRDTMFKIWGSHLNI